ncbi:class I adenylate-forming enzyme family protein [Dactylosporangium matsuzakiense]|uniref:Coronafacic acid synthetase n=1 Tax=Dactylosporangium matsuzakiense TaxID=53360 RepID=A0A9W6KTD4_9ACTN|nr:class I adenylate-forming enzyme family protein [Dactylosporangium matsuzakiense]UWZ42289.1 acyl--CoA ligase [Dactylosporangium matsuzakiense]GLL07283.1 coronafacic acid synthetase [Dactylosporangium matsuzakiense]
MTPLEAAEVTRLLDRSVDLGQSGPGPDLADVMADLARLGLPEGSPVVIAMANGRRLLTHYFAVLLTGAVPVAISPATPSARIARIAGELGAGAVIGARLEPGRYGTAAVRKAGDAEAVTLPRPRVIAPDHVLMLTSGTSGMFSACLHRLESLTRNARRHADAVHLRGDDTMLVNLPLYYSYAIVAQAFAALATGARLVIAGPPFSPVDYQAALHRHDVTSSSITPTIARLLLSQDRRLPATLRMLTVGGDRLDPAHAGALSARHPWLELYATYGLAEAGPRVSTLAVHNEPAHRHGSVGLPLAGVTVSTRPVAGHAPAGELLVATDTALVRKLGSTQRTLAAPDVIATGDLFELDDDGYLYFRGRLSDFLVVRGEKVSLHDVRQYVQSLPEVVRCSVVRAAADDGSAVFDLDVHVATESPDVERRIRRALAAFLLPVERPRTLVVHRAELATFQK